MRRRLVVFFAAFVGLTPAICAQPAISAVLNAASYSVTPTGNLTEPRQMHTATLLANGKVLIAGGYTGSSSLAAAELYDPATGGFTPTGDMAEPGADTATLLADGKVLITRSASGVLEDHADLYDPVAGMFTRTGNLFGPGANPTATLQNDGRVLIARGSLGDSSASTSAAIYDPTTGCGTTSAVRRSTIPLWTNSVLPEV
jgi:Kelch motif